jgi:hypothetical protein
MWFRRAVLRSVSPIGVAPPVNDDWAPIGRTVFSVRSTEATADSDAGATSLLAWPPGKWAASSRCAARMSGSRTIGGDSEGPRGGRARTDQPGTVGIIDILRGVNASYVRVIVLEAAIIAALWILGRIYS